MEEKKMNFKPVIGFIAVTILAIVNIIFGFVFLKENWLAASFAFLVAIVMMLMLFRLAKEKR